jgi:hypothetical protein
MEFKFGQRVLARNHDHELWCRARYVSYNIPDHCTLCDDEEAPIYRAQCKLDPDATEFISGDEVEVRDMESDGWISATYIGYNGGGDPDEPHIVSVGGSVLPHKYCRYPQSNEVQEKINELQKQIDQLKERL